MKDESLLEEMGESLLEETGDNLLEEKNNPAEPENTTRQKQLMEQLQKELEAAKKQREEMERRIRELEAGQRKTGEKTKRKAEELALNKKKEKSQQLRSNLRKSIKYVGVLVASVACGFGIYYLEDWIGKEIKEKEKQEKIEIQNRSLKDAGISVDDFSFNENASKNGLRGIEITLTLNCKCNTIAKTVITICNEKNTPYPAKNEDFSYEGNCAIVSIDSISSEKYILKKFVPFRSLPKVQCVKGVLFKEYGFWCDISIMDKNNVCVYTSSEELLFEKPADYDKLYASVSVDKVWVDHNIYQDGAKGMLIHVKFDVANALGENCKCVAYFYKVDGSKLKDTNNRFCTVDGQVSTSEDFSPPYESSYWKDFSFFMPYSELHVNSKNDLYFELVFFIYHSDGKYEEIGRYSKVTFTYDV